MGEGMGRTETNIDAHPITGAPVPPVGWACFAFSFSPFTSSSPPFKSSLSSDPDLGRFELFSTVPRRHFGKPRKTKRMQRR